MSGYLLKNVSAEDRFDTIFTVHESDVYISKEMVSYLAQGFVNRHKEDGDSLSKLQQCFVLAAHSCAFSTGRDQCVIGSFQWVDFYSIGA